MVLVWFPHLAWSAQSAPITFIMYMRLVYDMAFSNSMIAGSHVGDQRTEFAADLARGLTHST